VIQRLWRAESKDLGGAYFAHAARSFSTTEARQQDLAIRTGFPTCLPYVA
jgi:hypothetical protein